MSWRGSGRTCLHGSLARHRPGLFVSFGSRRVGVGISLGLLISILVRSWYLSPQHGLLIWFLYNFHLASVLRPSDFFLTYESVLDSNADNVIEALFDFLERSGMDPDRQGIDRARKYIDGRLNRAGDGVIDFSGDASTLAQGCRECYEAFVSGDGHIECFKSSFASLPRSLVDELSRYGRWDWAGLADSK